MDTVDIAWDECIPDLPLDTHHLPPLNALSTSCDSSHHHLDLLDILTLTPDHPEPADKFPTLSNITTPTPSGSGTASATVPAATPTDSHHTDTTHPESLSDSTANSAVSADLAKPCATHTSATTRSHAPSAPSTHAELVLELTTRLGSATAETTGLRKRLASLTQENRALRGALDHANARLVAVAQAAAQPPAHLSVPHQRAAPAQPVVLGLAQLSSDVAGRLGGALTVSDAPAAAIDESPRDRKKRKRVSPAAATTMACVMFMWGAFVGTPGLLKGSTSLFRSDANLPAVWKGESTSSAVAVSPVNAAIKQEHRRWQPNCMRVLQELPDGSDTSHDEDMKESGGTDGQEDELMTDGSKTEGDDAMFVDMEDKASADVVAHSDRHDPRLPQYSYVLCRDADAAMDSVKACARKARNGERCGQPHTISLILPAAAAGLEDNDTKAIGDEPALAEVQCSVLSVGRIPSSKGGENGSKYGRIIATVAETRTVIAE